MGNEPGYEGTHNVDRRSPREIVEDARILRGMLVGMGRDYRLALDGMSTPRLSTSPYRGRYGFDYWEEILELAEPELFDGFVIQP